LNNIDFDALAKELNMYEDTKNRYKQNYRWQQAAINSTNRLLERAEEVSPYYRKYKNTFGFEEGELEDLTAEYNTIKDVQGMETAD
jgi:phage terminase large subunit-like protein